MLSNQTLESYDTLTQLIKSVDIDNWLDLASLIKALPYNRNSNRTDLSLVWKEKKGTCSSKHAFLKHVADLNQIPNVELILGVYKMNSANTPKIGKALSDYQLDYIPEAHCYLKINDERIDYTSLTSDFNRIKDDILLEKIIEPQQVAEFKIDFHKSYLQDWIKNNNLPFSFEEVWQVREKCIASLSA